MNYTERAYIKLISGGINNEKADVEFAKVDTAELINLCKIHNNAGLVFLGLKNTEDVPEKELEVFEKGFGRDILLHAKRSTVMKMITDKLNEENIKHIIMKGLSIARLYPREELRTMGDIDFLVTEENMERVHKIMNRMNAKFYYEGSDTHVMVFDLNKINIEIHSRIAFGENLSGRYDIENYFCNAFDNAEQIENCTYILTPEYNMIYVLYHTAKHFYNGGCGVRMITDLAVMVRAYGKMIHWEWIWSQLESIGLKQFAQKIFAVCNAWFDISVPGEKGKFKEIETIEEYIISGGTFGHKNVDGDTSRIRKIKSKNYVISMLKWAFPSCKKMKEHSEWFKDKPAVLLPAAYVERFVRNARERGGIVNWLKLLYAGKNKSNMHDAILKIMELK